MSPLNIFFYGAGLVLLFSGLTGKVIANGVYKRFSDGHEYAGYLRIVSSFGPFGALMASLSVGLSEGLKGTRQGLTLIIIPLLLWCVISIRADSTNGKLFRAHMRELDPDNPRWQD